MEIIIDTNALVYAAKEKIDLFSMLTEQNYEIIVPTCVIKELKTLTKTAPSGAEKTAAKLALQLITHFKIKPLDVGEGLADDLILMQAKKNSAIIFTNDKPLKRRAKSQGLKTLSLGKTKQIR